MANVRDRPLEDQEGVAVVKKARVDVDDFDRCLRRGRHPWARSSRPFSPNVLTIETDSPAVAPVSALPFVAGAMEATVNHMPLDLFRVRVLSRMRTEDLRPLVRVSRYFYRAVTALLRGRAQELYGTTEPLVLALEPPPRESVLGEMLRDVWRPDEINATYSTSVVMRLFHLSKREVEAIPAAGTEKMSAYGPEYNVYSHESVVRAALQRHGSAANLRTHHFKLEQRRLEREKRKRDTATRTAAMAAVQEELGVRDEQLPTFLVAAIERYKRLGTGWSEERVVRGLRAAAELLEKEEELYLAALTSHVVEMTLRGRMLVKNALRALREAKEEGVTLK